MSTRAILHCDAPGCGQTVEPERLYMLPSGWLNVQIVSAVNGLEFESLHACSPECLAVVLGKAAQTATDWRPPPSAREVARRSDP